MFSKNDADIGRTCIIKHKIDTGAQPIKQPLFRAPFYMNTEIDKHIEDMLARDVITPSSSPWSLG